MNKLKRVYRILRSIILSVVLTMVGLYVLLYVAISLPPVQNEIRDIAERELSKLLTTDVSIGNIYVSPGGEAVLTDVVVPCPDGSRFASIKRLGAGIDLSELLFSKEIVFTYAEIIGLDGSLRQQSPGEPWNLQFIIDALKPKDKNKPPTKFDLKLRNVVIRSSHITVDKEWQKRRAEGMDFGHLCFENIRADLTLPQLKNDDFIIDLRRLSVREKSGIQLNKLAAKVHVTKEELNVDDLVIELPQTLVTLPNFRLSYNGYDDIVPALKRRRYELNFDRMRVTPADFAPFFPPLAKMANSMWLTADISGTLNDIEVRAFNLDAASYGIELNLKGRVGNPLDNRDRRVVVDRLYATVSPAGAETILSVLPKVPQDVRGIVSRLGGVKVDVSGLYANNRVKVEGAVDSGIGGVATDAAIDFSRRGVLGIVGHVETPGFQLGQLLDNRKFGSLAVVADADVTIAGKDVDGHAVVDLSHFDFDGRSINNVLADVSKVGNSISGRASVNDTEIALTAEGKAVLAGKDTSIDATLDIIRFNPGAAGLGGFGGYSVDGHVTANMQGIEPTTFVGSVALENVHLQSPRGPLDIPYFTAEASRDEGIRHVHISSPFIEGDVRGNYDISKLPAMITAMLAEALPAVFPESRDVTAFHDQSLEYKFTIFNDNTFTEYFNLPVRMLTDIDIDGAVDGATSTAWLRLDIPYLQQGKDKLIRKTFIDGRLDGASHSAMIEGGTVLPGKNDTDVDIYFSAIGANDNLVANVGWDLNRQRAYKGKVGMNVEFDRDLNGKRTFGVSVIPSTFQVNDTTWNIGAGEITYADKKVKVRDVSVFHGDQFVNISGDASPDPDDTLTVDLSKINLNYVFETLNINYVTFGGVATGRAIARNLFKPKEMEAYTENLKVAGLTYNGGLLGDADLLGRWHPDKMQVEIGAEIAEKGRHCASVNGGIWVARDSLSFDMATDKVNIKFMQPFMQAFTSNVAGRASGKVKLYGTFSDIDMTGRVFADTLKMKIDYTNVTYTGRDSVILTPGRIEIPDFRIYDPQGNSAIVNGELTHRYFHDPKFQFRITDARNLLCYNTDSRINPDWYGKIYGNGGGTITGRPGYVGIMVDMSVGAKSQFTFVLNETEAAADYGFLTFSDKRREAELREHERLSELSNDTVPDFVRNFKKRQQEMKQERPSVFALDLRATVNPDAEMVLVMDPVGGDKIRAHGSGALQLGYDSASDEMTMYGTYTLTEGLYNFTLQDLILKDFTIRPGSSITFNGDPLKAILDIEASYRVNTNLTDLDKSFASDRELNRTNVPVDAVLSVSGDMEAPDITFDIELPTLTQEVARKVKSIISTDDMMSRQIIYLLALNRFYTPEYMGSSGNGGEWASMASATVTSQLTNMLSQLTDKFTLAPALRTDKGDFSDMEVDVALSSRLLNNRLLLNGNFGYRDRSTSNTTFVGDFDIEYLLNRRGNLRLKAYNHFNDQNYYLKSSLTTQGIGVVYRQDFDNPFSFLRRKRKKAPAQPDSVSRDSIGKH